jgi:hypothetical protein
VPNKPGPFVLRVPAMPVENVCPNGQTDDDARFLWVDEITGRLFQIPRKNMIYNGELTSIQWREWNERVNECRLDWNSFVTAEMLTCCFNELKESPRRLFRTKNNSMLYTTSFSCIRNGQEVAAKFLWPLSFYSHVRFYNDCVNNTNLNANVPWLTAVRQTEPIRLCCETKNQHRPRPTCVENTQTIRDWTLLSRGEREFFLGISTRPTIFRNADVEVSKRIKHMQETKRTDAKTLKLDENDAFISMCTTPKRQRVMRRQKFVEDRSETNLLLTLPEDVLNHLFSFVVEDALSMDGHSAEYAFRRIVCVSSQFRDCAAAQSAKIVRNYRQAAIEFVKTGDVDSACKLLSVEDAADAPAALRMSIYGKLRCSPQTLLSCDSTNVLAENGLLACRANSTLSPPICNARAQSPELFKDDFASERIKTLINSVGSVGAA